MAYDDSIPAWMQNGEYNNDIPAWMQTSAYHAGIDPNSPEGAVADYEAKYGFRPDATPTTLKQARELGYFGKDIANFADADPFISKLFQSKGLDEQQAVAAAIQGKQAHQANFGQGYDTASSLSGIFNDFIFPAAGVAPDQNLETLPGWSRHDAEARGKKAADIEHGGDFGSSTGLGQILSYQSNLGGNLAEAYKKDPERAFLGINTPLESEVWGKALGKDYRPTVDMTGGSTSYDTQSAQAKGIDTQSGEAMQQIAKTLAMKFGGNAVNGLFSDGGTVSGSTGDSTAVGGAGNDTLGSGNMGEDGWTFDDFSGEWVPPGGGGLDMTRLDDPSYWNPEGGTTGLATPGASGIDGSTATFGSSDYLQQAKDMAAKFGITPASALQMLLKAAGRAAPAVLGAVGAKQQANSLSALADQYMGFGAPSRARYEASFAPGFTMQNDPGYMDALNQSSKATLHGLSVQGNPAGSPNAWATSLSDNYQKTAYPALQNFRNTNANAGGIASLQTAAPGAATAAIGAQGNVFNAIGAGANDIFNPPQSLAQQLADYQRLMKSQGSGAVQ